MSQVGIHGLSEVADLAGVSPATVSRAFNSPHLLKPATLKRVKEASDKLQYVPDGLARSLRSRRSMIVGAVMPSLRHAYFASTVEGLQLSIAKHGYTLLLATSNFDEQTELTAIRSMIRQGVDGVVLVGTQHHPSLLPLLQSQTKPFMITWTYDAKIPSVGFDHRRASRAIASHLLDLGHRDIVVLVAFLGVSERERERLAGIEEELVERGMSLLGERIIYAGGSSLQDGRNAMRDARTRFPRTSAVICANDLLAAGALLDCDAKGVRVPQDISITGYGDLEISAAMNPAITTIRTRADEMGRIAGECLVAKMSGETITQHIELSTELIVRGSTGPFNTHR